MVLIDKLFGPRAGETIRQDAMTSLPSTYRCVEIRANNAMPCAAFCELRGKRFLPDEIPDLPLPGCTADVCSCSYELFEDRRKHPRREGPSEDLNASLLRRDDAD